MQIVTEIQLTFGFRLPSAIIANTVQTFCIKYDLCDNQLHTGNSCLWCVGFLYDDDDYRFI